MSLGFAVVDDDRARRTGLPEVVYGEGKTSEQLIALLSHLRGQGHTALATRIDATKAAAVCAALPDAVYEPVPRLLWIAGPSAAEKPRITGHLAVVAAGTSDLPIAEECARCAELFGIEVVRITDVGVAGLHRLLSRVDTLQQARIIAVVAGMEGALPSVVAGLVKAPVIGVPTSVGYGAHQQGFTPLYSMLTACSGGIAVMNIDNGFGAAMFAFRVMTT
jgi:NCAIR mutase (PurE)-related protein